MRSSRLVAETLRLLPVPVGGALPPHQPADAATITTLWQSAWRPARSEATPPTFLRAEQRDAWRRALAAIERWNAALVADAVGSGKSWIALGLARHLNGATVVVAPAALEQQWRRIAAQAGVTIRWRSHERLSRGVALPSDADFAIIDEAHRFRHLNTRRTAVLAPWLAGRRAVMLTATPIVNRRADLTALLRLLFADDILAADGIASLRQLESLRSPPPALRRLIVRSTPERDMVAVRECRLEVDHREQQRGAAAVAAIGRMRLGTTAGIRTLIATVLLDAAASSDAAWRAALSRYRALLLQSRDAGGLSRAALRHFAGPTLDQLVLWPVLGDLPAGDPPPIEDLAQLNALLAQPPDGDAWTGAIAAIVADQRPTICFARHRATARLLVTRLGESTAWITGTEAGIGPHRLSRDQVIAAFGTGRSTWQQLRQLPTCLVATEVLAEGLDLQGANRVIHLDLPWHAARMEQRVGRVRRIGQLAPEIEVVIRPPAPPIERVLQLGSRVRRKGRLAACWLDALVDDTTEPVNSEPASWYAVATGGGNGIEGAALVGFETEELAGALPLELRDGIWHPAVTTAAPRGVLAPSAISSFEAARLRRLARRAAWRGLELARPAVVSRPKLVARLLGLARDARQSRNHQHLDRLDRLLGVASRAAPLGLSQHLDGLADFSDEALLAGPLPPPPAGTHRQVRWLAIVLYRPGDTPLR